MPEKELAQKNSGPKLKNNISPLRNPPPPMYTVKNGPFGGELGPIDYGEGGGRLVAPPLCDIPLGRCFFTGPWTVTRSSLRMLRRVAAFCRPLRPVLLPVSSPPPPPPSPRR